MSIIETLLQNNHIEKAKRIRSLEPIKTPEIAYKIIRSPNGWVVFVDDSVIYTVKSETVIDKHWGHFNYYKEIPDKK